MIVKLTVGDWSRDGHNQSDDYYIESNFNRGAIQLAYGAGAHILGDITQHCNAFEDGSLPIEIWNNVVQAGFDREVEDYDPNRPYVNLHPDLFVLLYLFIARFGNPAFNYEVVEADHSNTIRIGGYGLYST